MSMGLYQLHACGVVHCDVKLDNFFVHITGAAAALSTSALLQQPLHVLQQHVHIRIADLDHSCQCEI
jgi:serine/threonine protein kinase